MKVVKIAFILFIFSLGQALAQDAAKKGADPKAKKQWKSEVSLGGSWYEGTTNKTDFRGQGGVSRKDSIIELSAFAKADYSAVGVHKDSTKTVMKEEYSGGLKLDYKPESKVSPFVVFQLTRDVQRSLDSRVSGLAGAKWTYLKTKESEFSLSAAYVFDHERYVREAGATEDPEAKNISKLSIRPKFSQKIGKSVEFNMVAFYVLDLGDVEQHDDGTGLMVDEARNYTVNLDANISSKLTKNIYFKLSWLWDYIHNPSADARDTRINDKAYIASLVFKF